MAYSLLLKPKVSKTLDNLDDSTRARIRLVLDSIAQDPFSGKKLEGELKGKYSVRAWPYRIIYQVYKKELLILVVDLGHRQGIYK